MTRSWTIDPGPLTPEAQREAAAKERLYDAAPELLAALQALREAVWVVQNYGMTRKQIVEYLTPYLTPVDAAIAKAQGED